MTRETNLISIKTGPFYDSDRELTIEQLFTNKKKLEREYIKLFMKYDELYNKSKLPIYDFKEYKENKQRIYKYNFPQYPLIDNTETYYECTVTIDPQRHKGLMDGNARKIIFTSLLQCLKKEYMKGVYGCFEKQKNGNIHAHLLINAYKPDQFHMHIKGCVTDDSKYAVDTGYKENKRQKNTWVATPQDKIQGWIKYLNKDATFKEYFSLDISIKAD